MLTSELVVTVGVPTPNVSTPLTTVATKGAVRVAVVTTVASEAHMTARTRRSICSIPAAFTKAWAKSRNGVAAGGLPGIAGSVGIGNAGGAIGVGTRTRLGCDANHGPKPLEIPRAPLRASRTVLRIEPLSTTRPT